jgi:Protein of unknown function (DUF2569)
LVARAVGREAEFFAIWGIDMTTYHLEDIERGRLETAERNRPGKPQETVQKDGPRGIAGWLILPTIATITTPLFFLKDVLDGVTALDKAGSIANSAALNFAYALVADIGICAGWIVANFFLFQHKRAFPKLYIALMIAGVVYGLAFMSSPPTQDDINGIVRPLINVLIWGPYLVLSKRVANTFVN